MALDSCLIQKFPRWPMHWGIFCCILGSEIRARPRGHDWVGIVLVLFLVTSKTIVSLLVGSGHQLFREGWYDRASIVCRLSP